MRAGLHAAVSEEGSVAPDWLAALACYRRHGSLCTRRAQRPDGCCLRLAALVAPLHAAPITARYTPTPPYIARNFLETNHRETLDEVRPIPVE